MVFDAVPVVSSAVPDGGSGKAPEWPDESWERPDTKTPAGGGAASSGSCTEIIKGSVLGETDLLIVSVSPQHGPLNYKNN